ncbi:hypothetical protein USB125703_00523 [Pseudoclavibacter triregionum]|nr:hypothetical protein USB125703_00523 [Pseudoclavibacter triregionum]
MTQAAPDPNRPGGRFGDATLGNLLALASAVAYAGVNALLRSVAHEVDPFVSSLLRQVPLLLALAIMAIALRPASMRPSHPAFIGPKLAGAAFVGGIVALFLGNTLLFAALGWVGLGIATAALTGGNLVTSAMLSWIVLKERPTAAQFAGIGLMLAGLVFAGASAAGTPTELALAILGFVFSVLTGASYAIGTTINRRAQSGGGRFVPVLGSMTLGACISLALWIVVANGGDAWRHFAELDGRQLWTLLGAGALNGVALGCLTLAVRFTTVTAAMMLNALMIVFGVIFGVMFFGEQAPALLLASCALILGGCAAGQLRRRRGSAPTVGPEA